MAGRTAQNFPIVPIRRAFFEHRPEADGQVYTTSSYEQTADFVGLVNDYDAASGRVTLEQRNNVKEGETLEILTPGGTVFPWTLSDMEDETGTPIAAAPHAQMIFTAVGGRPHGTLFPRKAPQKSLEKGFSIKFRMILYTFPKIFPFQYRQIAGNMLI